MTEMLETRKYTITLEGETEQWYFLWLRDKINACTFRKYNISVIPKVQQSPRKFAKSINAKATPTVTHICDVESPEQVHVDKFQRILSEMQEAKETKRISYELGYSNFTFELWMILHKKTCNGSFIHRSQYLEPINQAFNERFEDLAHYKREDNFKRCLSKLSLQDVERAIERAETIMESKKTDQKKKVYYKGYSYYPENPALTIHKIVSKMMKECGVM